VPFTLRRSAISSVRVWVVVVSWFCKSNKSWRTWSLVNVGADADMMSGDWTSGGVVDDVSKSSSCSNWDSRSRVWLGRPSVPIPVLISLSRVRVPGVSGERRLVTEGVSDWGLRRKNVWRKEEELEEGFLVLSKGWTREESGVVGRSVVARVRPVRSVDAWVRVSRGGDEGGEELERRWESLRVLVRVRERDRDRVRRFID
jgi:hypothetical protein